MELIRISDQKLKIMLTPLDMTLYDFSVDGFGANSEKMHRAFRRLLEDVHRQIDFDADDHHLSVQYFPSREGGCEMFISNLPCESDTCQPISGGFAIPERGELIPHPTKHTNGSFQKESAYRFEKLTYLLATCKRLCKLNFICESTAWQDDKNDYFLFLSMRSTSPYSTPEELDFIVEYGSVENASTLRMYVREHGRQICPTNAIARLGALL